MQNNKYTLTGKKKKKTPLLKSNGFFHVDTDKQQSESKILRSHFLFKVTASRCVPVVK